MFLNGAVAYISVFDILKPELKRRWGSETEQAEEGKREGRRGWRRLPLLLLRGGKEKVIG